MRSFALWFLGFPQGARTDAENALNAAREIGNFSTLILALNHIEPVFLLRGDYEKSTALSAEQFRLADENGAWYLKMFGLLGRGHVPALTGDTERAIELLTSGINGIRSAGGATVTFPFNLSLLAMALMPTRVISTGHGAVLTRL